MAFQAEQLLPPNVRLVIENIGSVVNKERLPNIKWDKVLSFDHDALADLEDYLDLIPKYGVYLYGKTYDILRDIKPIEIMMEEWNEKSQLPDNTFKSF